MKLISSTQGFDGLPSGLVRKATFEYDKQINTLVESTILHDISRHI